MRFVKKMLSKIGLKRKGITPVIAIVLLLMMTVAAAGMAYVWIMSVQEGIASDTDQDISNLQDEKNTRLEIVNVYNDSGEIGMTIRNAGTHVFSAAEAAAIGLYIDGVSVDISTVCTALKGQGTTCEISGSTTSEDYPTVVGSDGAREIKVVPPLGTGDVHNCAISTMGKQSTC
ncbi:MAG: archaellin/type IV pilin N-terminal domain-containing protein [archaeon]